MKKIRVMTVLGTRPEAIKLAPVVQQLASHSEFESIVIATAQHREMLDQVLELFHIQPEARPEPDARGSIPGGIDRRNIHQPGPAAG